MLTSDRHPSTTSNVHERSSGALADAEEPVAGGVERERGERALESAEAPVHVADDEVAAQPIGRNVVDWVYAHATPPRGIMGSGKGAMVHP